MENLEAIMERNQEPYVDALEPVRDSLHRLIALYDYDQDDVDVALRVDDVANGLQEVFRSSHVLVHAAYNFPELFEDEESPIEVLKAGLAFLKKLKRKLTKNPSGGLQPVGEMLEERLPPVVAVNEEDELAGLMSGVGL
jgi:hypothetical protein